MTQSLALRPGSMFEGYELLSELKGGSFGRVYRARQQSTGQLVAVKVLRADEGENPDPKQTERFRREMRLCAELSHPNIVRLIDSGESSSGVLYAVFEYVSGSTLEQVLAEEGALSGREAVHLMSQVLDALACAHRRGVVHRDLKPANIMVTRTGARRNAQVLDFGLGGLTTAGDSIGPRITLSREFMGTPGYAAPEQVRGEPAATSSDLYSWGLIFLECLTGRPALEGGTIQHVVHQQLGPDPIPIPERMRDRALGRLLASVTAKNPELRGHSAALVLAELERVPIGDVEREVPWGSHASADPLTAFPPGGANLERSGAAQQRQVTVLSVRVSAHPLGGGKAETRLDALDRQVTALRSLSAELAARAGGHVVGVLGGRVMLVFGFPLAQEDALLRALRAALDIADEVGGTTAAENRGLLRTEVRVGIHTGLAIAAPTQMDAGVEVSSTALDAAAQLDAIAGAGEILISAATRELLHDRDIALEPVQSAELRAAGAPSAAYRVAPGQRKALSRRARILGRGTMVGRSIEAGQLHNALEHARAGDPQVMLLVGDAGIGKTRLIRELRRSMGNAAWMEIDCRSEAQSSPLRPIVDFLTEMLGDQPLDDFLNRHALAPDVFVPPLAALLSLPRDERYPPLAGPPARQREIVFRALLSLFLRVAEAEPLVLVVEDLHWADPTTLELLSALVEELSGGRVGDGGRIQLLFVLSTRSETDLPRAMAEATPIRLGRLQRANVEELIVSLMPAGRSFSPSLVAEVVRRTDGVPLFVEETVRVLVESATSEEADLVAASDLGIPTTLRDLLAARLERLSVSARATARQASALGREFALSMLQAVTGRADAPLENDLAELCEAGLLFRRRAIGAERYFFKHALVCDAAYESMIPSARRRAHEKIALWLRASPDVEREHPELLAHHFERAEIAGEALRYWKSAGCRALSKSANIEASIHFTRALELVPRLDDSESRLELEVDLQLDLIRVLVEIEGYGGDRLLPCVTRAQALSERLGDVGRLGEALVGTWAYHVVRADTELAYAYAERQAELAEKTGDPIQQVAGLHARGLTAFFTGSMRSAVEWLSRSTELYFQLVASASDEVRANERIPVLGITTTFCGWSLLFTGRPQAGLDLLESILRYAREIDHPIAIAETLNHLACFWHDVGEPERVMALAQETLDLCTRKELDYRRFMAESELGWALVRLGTVEEGLRLGKKGLVSYLATGARVPRAYMATYHIDALRMAEQPKAALALADDILRECAGALDRFYDAELHRLRGDLWLDLGDPERASEAFRQAHELALVQGARWLELRTATSLAGDFVRRDRAAEARPLLVQALAGIEGDRPWRDVTAARKLLSQIDG